MDQQDLDKKASSEALDHIKDNQILAFQSPNETESPREVTKFLFNQVQTIAHNFYINLKNLETNLLSKISKPSDEYILSIELCKTHLAKRDESKLFRDLNLHGLINGVKDSFNQFHYSQIDNLSKMYIKNLKSYKVKPYDPANSTEYKALCLKRLRMGSILLSSFLLIKVLYGWFWYLGLNNEFLNQLKDKDTEFFFNLGTFSKSLVEAACHVDLNISDGDMNKIGNLNYVSNNRVYIEKVENNINFKPYYSDTTTDADINPGIRRRKFRANLL